MTVCPHTSLHIPECCCTPCIERQLAEFAPRTGPRAVEEAGEAGGVEEATAFAPEREAAA